MEIDRLGRQKPRKDVRFVLHIVGKSEGETSAEIVAIVELLSEMTF